MGASASRNRDFYRKLAGIIQADGMRAPVPESLANLEALLLACGGQYLTSGVKSRAQIKKIRSTSSGRIRFLSTYQKMKFPYSCPSADGCCGQMALRRTISTIRTISITP